MPKQAKPKVPKKIVRSYLTLNIIIELGKPKSLLQPRLHQNVSTKLSPSAANTTLGICYTCVVLCCSAHGCCAVECGVACCTAQHTAIATLTTNLVETKYRTHFFSRRHNKTQHVCKKTIYWATKHAQITKKITFFAPKWPASKEE